MIILLTIILKSAQLLEKYTRKSGSYHFCVPSKLSIKVNQFKCTNLIWQTELGESLDETEVDTVEVMSVLHGNCENSGTKCEILL